MYDDDQMVNCTRNPSGLGNAASLGSMKSEGYAVRKKTDVTDFEQHFQ